MDGWGKKICNKNTDGQGNLQRYEEACSRWAIGVDFGPLQKAWRVSKVTKSFHFLSSKGITLTFLRKFSHLSQDKLELKNKKESVRYETKPDEDTKSRRLTRLLDNPSSVIKSVRHASPLLRPAHQLCPLDEKVHILPIPVGIWHVRH